MDTIRAACAAVTGARHARSGRNGQDAAATWLGDGAGAVVVCDGCSAGGSSEVGARLGAQLAIAIVRGELAHTRAAHVWPAVRARLAAELARIVDAICGDRQADRERVVYEHFLFTIVAGAWRGDEAAVWALGDGGYALGDRARVLGPFADNSPPYLGYDLLGAPEPSHLEVADAACGSLVVATDGAAELGLATFADARYLAHPDALRRRLAVLARGCERIDWSARRVVREPAPLQDDGAVAILRWA